MSYFCDNIDNKRATALGQRIPAALVTQEYNNKYSCISSIHESYHHRQEEGADFCGGQMVQGATL